MEARLETPTRRRWREVISRYADSEDPEYRRSDQRSYVQDSAVKLSFSDRQGTRVERAVVLLNVSESGLMIKQPQNIAVRTKVQVDVTIGEARFVLWGCVAHVTQTIGGFKIGIELQFAD